MAKNGDFRVSVPGLAPQRPELQGVVSNRGTREDSSAWCAAHEEELAGRVIPRFPAPTRHPHEGLYVGVARVLADQRASGVTNSQLPVAADQLFWATPTPAWEIVSTCSSPDATDEEPTCMREGVSILCSRPACKAPATTK